MKCPNAHHFHACCPEAAGNDAARSYRENVGIAADLQRTELLRDLGLWPKPSPLRTWLRKERAQESARYVATGPLVFERHTAHFDVMAAEIEASSARHRAIWAEVWGSPEQARQAREDVLRLKGWLP